MATYRCLASGNTVTFTLQHDIDSMRGHAGYVLVEEEQEIPLVDLEAVRTDTPLTPPKRRPGRPRRVSTEGV